MKIKLISPKSTKRKMDSDWKRRMSPPLALLILGALTPKEHQVQLVDENVEKLKLNDKPDLVAITVKIDTAPRSYEIAFSYQRRGIPVIMGGIHATAHGKNGHSRGG